MSVKSSVPSGLFGYTMSDSYSHSLGMHATCDGLTLCNRLPIAVDEHDPDGLRNRCAQITTLDIYKHFVYNFFVIQSFASSETEHFFATGKSRRLPRDILKRAAMRLTQLDGAAKLEDLHLPPSNRLEVLARDRAGQWSIRINDQWRLCFRFEKGDAYDVAIVDYH